VRAGKIALGSVLRAPFGCAPGLDLSGLVTVELKTRV